MFQLVTKFFESNPILQNIHTTIHLKSVTKRNLNNSNESVKIHLPLTISETDHFFKTAMISLTAVTSQAPITKFAQKPSI